uniref:RelA/SpoT family protein n=1 Tax=Luminiphilus syltensis TaxID=1341119 RepID=UPI00058D252C|nr:RelA/SpoT family protein [Luminiphilus syltensis]
MVHSQQGSLDALENVLKRYLPEEQIEAVKRAYYFAEQAHYGQVRRSGEPYVTHPLAVAGILANMHLDAQSLLAALLHDVIEDTGVTKHDIAAQFGDDVADLVDGVSKLTHIEFDSAELKQAENFQKMTLAMSKDIRVILVKLADRLHNMRTLGVLNRDKMRRIARETLEIYAPIAMRLGMNEVRMEFEDLGFRALHPMRSKRIEAAVIKARGNRKALVENIQQQLSDALDNEGISADILGREKHLYSIYRKMKVKRKLFSEIMDLYAFRVVVDTVDACYRTLGIVHSLYKPVPGEFNDYIAIPKSNGYQSLHTVLKGMNGVPIEIQIRTREMEDMANSGVAAHWLYKTEQGSTSASHARARQWVQGLLEMQERTGDSLEFIENVKIDLFPDEVYIFTPKGDIMELPRGATAVDFAYAVHTEIGNRCVACRINKRLAPLSEALESGQSVEIVTSPSGRPSPAWFNFVVTARARTNIRHFLKDQRREDSVELGSNILEKALRAYDTRLRDIDEQRLDHCLERFGQASLEALYVEIGVGNLLPHVVAAQLSLGNKNDDDATLEEAVAIRGSEGFAVTYAKCCCPLPGDPIAGYLSQERGIVVHRDGCANLSEKRDQPERLMALRWDEEIDGQFAVGLRVEAENRRGIIAVIANRLSVIGLNIERISSHARDTHFTYIDMELKLSSRIHLARIMKRLRTIDGVRKVTRTSRR